MSRSGIAADTAEARY